MRAVLVFAVVVSLAGCLLPHRSGWRCASDEDCASGLTCRAYSKGGVALRGDRICASPDATALNDASVYDGKVLALAWVGVGLGVLAIVGFLTRKKWRAWAERSDTLLKIVVFLVLAGVAVGIVLFTT